MKPSALARRVAIRIDGSLAAFGPVLYRLQHWQWRSLERSVRCGHLAGRRKVCSISSPPMPPPESSPGKHVGHSQVGEATPHSARPFPTFRSPATPRTAVVRNGRRCGHHKLLIQRGRKLQKALASKVHLREHVARGAGSTLYIHVQSGPAHINFLRTTVRVDSESPSPFRCSDSKTPDHGADG
jgi:hypothetical protein